jgi:chromosomal replication initiator protein
MKRGIMHDSLWQAVLGEIELSVSRGSFVTWFKNTALLREQDGVYTVGVPNIFIKQQLEKKFDGLIRQTLEKNGITPKGIDYRISSQTNNHKKIDDQPIILSPSRNKEAAPAPIKSSQNALSHSYRQGLNVRYTFDTFIVGGANELAYAACQAIAQNPGTKYNPLFLYGGVGNW